MSDNSKEYLMMREEILQYLEQYQVVRNMMYIVTGTLLGFGVNGTEDRTRYLFLLPLIVIIPSYIVAIDYAKCVRKTSAYLAVFHEQKEDCLFHWKSRHRMFGYYIKPWRVNAQLLPYYICGITCFGLYFSRINYTNYLDVLVGVTLFVISLGVILLFKNIKYSDYLNAWENVKDDEMRKNNDDK